MKCPTFLFVLRNQKQIKITHIVSIRNCRIKLRNTHAICGKNFNSKQRVTLFILETTEADIEIPHYICVNDYKSRQRKKLLGLKSHHVIVYTRIMQILMW